MFKDMAGDDMFNEIIKSFYDNRDNEQSIKMAAYMKNNFPFLGLSRPKRDELQKEFLKESKKLKSIDWDFVFKCWDLPEREFQYLAVDYLLALKKYINDEDIEKIQRLIMNKSWWDSVDIIAETITGQLCAEYPYLIDKYILKWYKNENIWLRRTAILFQLKYKEKTDTALMKKIILENCNSKEFFINKAIGWILREYSKTDKEWVRSFIESNDLNPLCVREGSKYI